MDATNINIVRPKKDAENTYVGRIVAGAAQSSKRVTHRFENAVIVDVKPTSRRGENVILVKCKNAVSAVYDLQQRIIDIVKNKSHVWFDTAMTPDLIEDYFTDLVVTHRVHGGHVLRLKCFDTDDQVFASFLNRTVDFDVEFCHVRFYRQKFVVECTIDQIQEKPSATPELLLDSDIEDEDEEIAEPLYEDVQSLRRECVDALMKRILRLEEELASLKMKTDNIDDCTLDELYEIVNA